MTFTEKRPPVFSSIAAIDAERLLKAVFRLRVTEMANLDDIDTSGIDPELLANPLFRELVEEGLAIQDRFSAEPVYATTGKGYLISAGVDEIRKIKEAEEAKWEPESSGPTTSIECSSRFVR
ncbi:MAG TPA: hypothetical protein VMN36_09930 [Verrucomicrobiales bacterium]|nr:hypothetical protein [Verrucomicrobiales bacterium]